MIRSYIALLLVAVLTLTGHSMAIARGMPNAAGVIELCTGHGPVIIAVDTDGNPTGQTHLCPDYVLILNDAAAAPKVAAQPLSYARQASRFVETPVILESGRDTLFARGPPTVI